MFDPSKEYFGVCPLCGASETNTYGKGLTWACDSWHNFGQDITESEFCKTRRELARVKSQRDAWAGKRHAEWCCGPYWTSGKPLCCCGHCESLEGLSEERKEFELEDPDRIDRLEHYIASLEFSVEELLDGLESNYDPEVCGLSNEEWSERINRAEKALYNKLDPLPTRESLITQKALNWVRAHLNLSKEQFDLLREALNRVKSGGPLRQKEWENE